MAKLIYISNVSLDGFIEDARGSFDWTAPDEEVFAFITDLVRSVGTYLYGRRMYETMAVWETDATLAAQSEPHVALSRAGFFLFAETLRAWTVQLEDGTDESRRVAPNSSGESLRRIGNDTTNTLSDVGRASRRASSSEVQVSGCAVRELVGVDP
jgi:dihydrofolate reductase